MVATYGMLSTMADGAAETTNSSIVARRCSPST
jgi:hypothetical protein